MATWLVKSGTVSMRLKGSQPARPDEVEWEGNPPAPLFEGHKPMVWDAGIGNVRPKNAAELLEDQKKQKLDAINARSQKLFAQGLPLNGVTYSLSREAQINLLALAQDVAMGRDLDAEPQGLSTTDDGEHMVDSAVEFGRIATLYKTRKQQILDAGRTLRLQVKAAVTQAELDAVTDNRV